MTLQSAFARLTFDLRAASKTIVRNPFGSGIIVATLALGIGANVAMFALVDDVLLKMLAVEHPKELFVLTRTGAETGEQSFSSPAFRALSARTTSFTGTIGFSIIRRMSMIAEADTELVQSQLVSGNFFTGLGVKASVGRVFTAVDDLKTGSQPVAVLSDSFWSRRFGRDRGIVGRSIALNKAVFTIIGVADHRFYGLSLGSMPDVWIPLTTQARVETSGEGDAFDRADWWWIRVIGRLKPGSSAAQANAELSVLYSGLLAQWAAGASTSKLSASARQQVLNTRITLSPAGQGLGDVRKRLSRSLLVLFGGVGVLLLVACMNIAVLNMSRALGRQKELAVRICLGAGRGAILWQLCAESILLATLGGAVGLIAGAWLHKAFVLVAAPEFASALHFQVDPRVVVFVVGLVVLTSVLFGVAPAASAMRLNLNDAIRQSGRGIAGKGSFAGSRAMIVSQVALSMVLLVMAGLLLRTLNNLRSVDAGFRSDQVLLLSVRPGIVGYKAEQVTQLYSRLIQDFRSLPGIRTASVGMFSPLDKRGSWTRPFILPGEPPREAQDTAVSINVIGPEFFSTLGIPVLSGHEFDSRETSGSMPVAIVSESTARHFFGAKNPIGRQFSLAKDAPTIQIVGVVRDVKYEELRDTGSRYVYIDYRQQARLEGMTFALRASSEPAHLASAAVAMVRSADKTLPVFELKTMEKQVEESLAQESFMAQLSAGFAAIALFLCALGLYGVMSSAVLSRTNEIGVRMALGASRSSVLYLIIRHAALITVAGVVAGLLPAVLIGGSIQALLYGVQAADPLTIAAAIAAITGVAMLAAFLPASRAAATDPNVALRQN